MLVIGVAGTELTAQERDWLQQDACAGVILFKRNFASKTQVAELSAAIREAAVRPQLICVDQEGGRVQRFRDGYADLPPLENFGALYQRDPEAAKAEIRRGVLDLPQEGREAAQARVRALGDGFKVGVVWRGSYFSATRRPRSTRVCGDRPA